MKKIWLSFFMFSGVFTIYAQGIKYPMGILTGQDKAYARMPEKAALTRNFGVRYQLKPAVSLREFAPIPGNQKKYNTSTAWASAYCARTILEAIKNGWTNNNYITSKAYSAGFQYRVTTPNNQNCEGAYTADCVNSLMSIGAIPEVDFLSAEEDRLCPNNLLLTQKHYSLAAAHKIDDLVRLWPFGFRDNQEKIKKVKHSISENNPVIISMICPNSFFDASGVWNPDEAPDYQHEKHAMCVIGYDDKKYGGAIEVQNSWGTNWGNSGRIWIRYDDFAQFTYQAYEIIELSKSNGNNQESLFEGTLRLVDINTNTTVPVRVAEKTRNFTTRHSKGKYTYKSTKPYSSGTEIRMFLESKTPAFVYILGTGSNDTRISTLFPEEGISAALNYKENEIALPGEYSSFLMDETVGTDYLVVIFSKSKIDILALQSELSKGTGHIADNLKKALGSKLIESDDIYYESETINFKVKQNLASSSLMVMVLAFEHIAK